MVPWRWVDQWPENVWIGTSVEDQNADQRIPKLLKIPAKVRFLSCEPLLGPINLDEWLVGYLLPDIHWVIVGGESGPHARPMSSDWGRALRDQCKGACVPFFFKQWGDTSPDRDPQAHHGGDLLDGQKWQEFPK